MLRKPIYGRLFFDADAGNGEGGGAGSGESGDKPNGEKPAAPTYSDEQQRDIDRRIAAARRQAEADAKARLEQTAAEKAEAERVERERKAAEERGEFDKVRQSLEAERDTFKTDAQAKAERLERYEAVIGPLVAERLEAVKAASPDVAEGFPKDADTLSQLDWLNDPRTKALIAQGTARTESYTRHVNTPNPMNRTNQPLTSPIPASRISG